MRKKKKKEKNPKLYGLTITVNINISVVLLGFTSLLIGEALKLLSEILRSTETTVELMKANGTEQHWFLM